MAIRLDHDEGAQQLNYVPGHQYTSCRMKIQEFFKREFFLVTLLSRHGIGASQTVKCEPIESISRARAQGGRGFTKPPREDGKHVA